MSGKSQPPSAAEERLRSFPTFHRLSPREMFVVVVVWVLLIFYSISYSYARGKLSIPSP
jgi:hypothetical protein